MKMALILLGAAVGGPMRFVIDQKIRTYTTKPYGIFTVNIVGSFVLGLSFGSVQEGFDLFVIGFAGAFTTWSTFMLDISLAYESKRHKEAWVNLVVSLSIGLFAAWIGLQLAQ
jgi:CrcB protein